MNKYLPVIGLEVHVELKTKSKMFCGCSTQYFGKKPNTHTCPVCLGLPGALPVPNKKAIEWCIMIGMALNCDIPLISKFDRKNYFYPDLSKGYQISQYDRPFAVNGLIKLKIKNDESKIHEKTIRIRRVHMEEDTGKLIHQFTTENLEQGAKNKRGISLIDFNRSGVPLVEIVTEPDFENALQVKEYLQKLQQIIRYLGVSDADMEKGEMRLEPNISLLSLRAQRSNPVANKINNDKNLDLPNYKVEVKNINSFRFVEKAINYEIKRQEQILTKGKTPVQETRGWDEKKQKTFSQRVKEEAQDYRYFPEPDIPPIRWTEKQISDLKELLPELPDKKVSKFENKYSLSYYDAEILTREKSTANYFEETVSLCHPDISLKHIANWIINKNIDIKKITPEKLIGQISSAKQTVQMDEGELNKIIKQVLLENSKAVEDYKKGKQASIMFLLGQTMKKIGKKVDATMVKEKIEKELL
ncbi:Asp-tRNA(Asn)/Glu-tRNA(Gln) amidotransferase subunit GatB [Patescibacteria group bacterium]|nr:Asp-tRNA(Asn)/Glu-tRNA(Gln) amidotransferase subunit GatB [Patescibacteria group bacterium]